MISTMMRVMARWSLPGLAYEVFISVLNTPKTMPGVERGRKILSRVIEAIERGQDSRDPSWHGGSERCLILDVEDNVENYSRSLAFSDLIGSGLEPPRVDRETVRQPRRTCG